MDIQPINLKKNEQNWSYALGTLLAIATGGILFGLYVVMPFLVVLAKNTLYFLLMLAASMGILVTLGGIWSERELWHYKWKNYVRRLRRAIVREDPVGVIETAIKRFNQKLEIIEEKLTEAVAALRSQITAQKDARKKQETAEAQYHTAKGRETDAVLGRLAASADMWKETADEMQPLIDMMTNMIRGFEQAKDLATNTIAGLRDRKAVMEVRQRTAKAGQTTARAFKAFFGQTDDSDMMAMGFDELELQINTSEAEIDQFMRVIEPKLKDEKLKNDAEASAAIARLEGFNAARKSLPEAVPVEVISVSKVSESQPVRR